MNQNLIEINEKEICIKNASIHNIKNLSLNIPLNKFVSIIGKSGSGKSSLIYDLFFKQYELKEIENDKLKVYALKQRNYIYKNSIQSTGEYNLEKFYEIKKELNKGDILILDEPYAGLNEEDTLKYINEIKKLVKIGISVIVVEHSKTIIKNSDYIIEFGPGAGKEGGKVIFEGEISKFKLFNSDSSKLIFKENKIKVKKEIKLQNLIKIKNINKNNLIKFNLEFPLYKLTTISGKIGSGKSTLLEYIYKSIFKGKDAWKIREDINYIEENIVGKQNVRRTYIISQNPISNNPNSIVASYINILNEIRDIYSQLDESKNKKLTKKDFNIDKELDITKVNSKVLEVKYKNYNIYEVLNLTIDEVIELFKESKIITRKLEFLQELDLGYIILEQKSGTLSGGEAQRIKLAKILTKKLGNRCLYLLDIPSKGLHIKNIPNLLNALKKIIDKKNTIVVVENNIEIINESDYNIDLSKK